MTATHAERQRIQRTQRARQKRALGAPPNGNHGYSAYSNWGCRCQICATAWRNDQRRRKNVQPSRLALEVDRLNQELDAAELNINALREENTILRCRLEELEET